jgi:competence protein ComEA
VVQVNRRDAAAIGLAIGGLAILIAAAWLLIPALATSASVDPSVVSFSPGVAADSPGSPSANAEVIVDVQGAVRRPGVVRLPAGSRVADALRAAGGYSREADLNAAATALNLAALLTDGSQVVVPMIGSTAVQPGGGTGGSGGGLVNLNTATPEQLEALPGIGPVTVQKIVAARTEQPFATLQELVDREVIDRGQLEDIQDLVTL